MTANAAGPDELSWLKRLKLPIETGNYPYVTARVRAKKSALLRPEMYARLLKMSIAEISRSIGEGEYKAEIVELGARYSGVDLIEMATRNNLAKVYTQIIEFSEGDLRTMISHFADRWDMQNLKTIIRGKLYGADEEEIWEDVVPAGSLTAKFLRGLVAMESVQDIVEAVRDTIYHEPLRGLTEEPDIESLAAYEDALSHIYYADLLEAIPPTTEAKRLFRTFTRRGIDVLNLLNLLRLRLEGGEVGRDVFIAGGFHLSVDDLEAMLEMEDEALLGALRKTPVHDIVAPLLPDVKAKGLVEVSRALEMFARKQASKYAHTRPLSVLPVLDYMLAKETEVENLRIISRGKAANLDEELIRRMLVT